MRYDFGPLNYAIYLINTKNIVHLIRYENEGSEGAKPIGEEEVA